MGLSWDFCRELESSATPGNTTSYYDTTCQSFYIDDGHIKTQDSRVYEGQWQDIDRNAEKEISDSGYSILYIDHSFNGTVFGIAQHGADVVFLKYDYMMDVSDLTTDGSWQMQPDNPIKLGSVTLMNTDNELFEESVWSIFVPGNKIRLRFKAGNSMLYEIGSYYIESSPFSALDDTFTFSGRNKIGFFLAGQTFDEYINYTGTLTNIFESMMNHAGLPDGSLLIETTATTGKFKFNPEDTVLDGFMSALDIANWYMEDTPYGTVVIGSAGFVRTHVASTGLYTFNRDSGVFSRSISRQMDGVYSRLCLVRKGDHPKRIYTPINYFDGWNLAAHRTLYKNVPDDTTQAEMEVLSTKLATNLQYSGIVEDFDSPFRPWLQIGDVAKITGGAATRYAGIITDIEHAFGEDGFYTKFSVASGGSISDPEGAAVTAFVGKLGGINRRKRLLDFFPAEDGSGSAGTSEVGAVTYQAAVSGGYDGTEQDLYDNLALVGKGAVLPVGGNTGQVLTKETNSNYDLIWADAAGGTEGGLPIGGDPGQMLVKSTADDFDAIWVEAPIEPNTDADLPIGGTSGQILAKNANDNYAVAWVDPPEENIELPPAGGTGQVLAKASVADYDVAWINPPEGGSSIAKTGSGTITTTGWVANTGDYAYKLDVADATIESTDILSIIIAPDSQDLAIEAELCPTAETYTGGITFYAQQAPSSAIAFTYAAIVGQIGAATPTGDGTEDTYSGALANSAASFSGVVVGILANQSIWLKSIKLHKNVTDADVTLNILTWGLELIQQKTGISLTGATYNTIVLNSPIELIAGNYYLFEFKFSASSQTLSRTTSYNYNGPLWKMIQARANNVFGTAYSTETPGFGLIEYS